MPRPFLIAGPVLWVELIYSAIVIISCLAVYWRTKEIYDLTSHKGIKYFRNAFLFFAIAYLSRFLLRAVIIVSDGPIERAWFILGSFIFVYAGLAAGLLLIYSFVWKQVSNPDEYSYLLHGIALIIAFLSITPIFRLNFLVMLAALFLAAALLAYSYRNQPKNKKNKESVTQVYLIYILLFLAWVANGAAHFFLRVSFETGIVLYIISALLFLLIAYRVIKSTTRVK